MDGSSIEIDATLENSPAVLFYGMVLPDGAEAVGALSRSSQALEFLKDEYRHCKTILALGAAVRLWDQIAIKRNLPTEEPDPGLLLLLSDAYGGEAGCRSLAAAVGLDLPQYSA